MAPASNTLSHIADCLAVAERLPAERYRVSFVVTDDKHDFVTAAGYVAHASRELWQDKGAQNVPAWLEDAEGFAAVAKDELKVLRALAPDMVIGSYRFTTRLVCQRLGLPLFSIVGPSMSPAFRNFLGVPQKALDDRSIQALMRMYRDQARALSAKMPDWDFAGIKEVRDLLVGERTFFHTVPKFEPLEGLDESFRFVGPLAWSGWRSFPRVSFERPGARRVVIFLGSGAEAPALLDRLAYLLDRPELEVILVGPKARRIGTVRCMDAADLDTAIADCDLAVIHGGLNALHHCLFHGKPALLLPGQVEQAQNALRAEQIGIGRNLLGAALRPDSESQGPSRIIKLLKRFLRFHEQAGAVDPQACAAAILEAAEDRKWAEACARIGQEWRRDFAGYGGAAEIRAELDRWPADPSA